MDKLNILWTTDNKDTILHMLVMYAINSKANNWWKEVNIIIWGASARLVGTDPEIQAEVAEMVEHGIKIEACKACCDRMNVTEQLKKLGVDVRYMGEPLTDYLKSGEKMLTI
jgi:hypothetical protein